MSNEKFNVVIVGIIFDPKTRKILVGKAKGDEKYSFLEGNLTHNEELDVRLKKVTTEKTGYIVHNLGAVYAQNCLNSHGEELKIYFLCEATEGQEKLGENIEEILWVKPSEVEEKLGVSFPTRLKGYIEDLESF